MRRLSAIHSVPDGLFLVRVERRNIAGTSRSPYSPNRTVLTTGMSPKGGRIA